MLPVAASLSAAAYSLLTLIGFGQFPSRVPNSASADLSTVLGVVDYVLKWGHWLARGPGVFVPLVIGAAALVHRALIQRVVLLIAIYQALSALTDAASETRGFVRWALSYGSSPLDDAIGGSYALADLTPCFLPLAVLAFLRMSHHDPAPHSSIRIAAHLTRVVLVTNAVVLLVSAGILAIFLTIRGFVRPSMSSPQNIALHAVSLPWAALLVVCGWRLIRYDRFSTRVLWVAVIGDGVAWLVTSAVGLAWERDMLSRVVGTPPTAWPYYVGAFLYYGFTIPTSGVLLWYWWRLIVGRRSVPLGPDTCGVCGYNLTGNVSGICPECGTSLRAAQ